MTSNGFFTSEEYDGHRDRTLTYYVKRMTEYLHALHPEDDIAEIEAFVKEDVKRNCKVPTIDYRHYPTEGNMERKETGIIAFCETVLKQNIVSPSGSVYCPPSKRESLLRITLFEKVKKRGVFKKQYLAAEERGDEITSRFFNGRQQSEKVFNNAIAGAMQNGFNAITSQSGFNATTSMSRLCVKQGYSFIERAVVGNIRLVSEEMALSYCLNHLAEANPNYPQVITKYALYRPSIDEVMLYLCDNIKKYSPVRTAPLLLRYITALSENARTFIFYAGNFNNLCRFNPELMHGILDACFPQSFPDDLSDIDPKSIHSYEEDLVAAVTGTQYELFGSDPETGKRYNLKEAIAHNPTGAKQTAYICQQFDSVFQQHLDLFRFCFHQKTTFTQMVFQEQMSRECVSNSDTDSAIYFTQNLVEWRRGKLDFSKQSYEMNAFITFTLSQGIKHYLAQLCCGMGVETADLFLIAMKNEFLYDLIFSSALAKHYIAIATIQEGKLLAKYRTDIKGVGFRSSAYPEFVKDSFTKYVLRLFDLIRKDVKIHVRDVMEEVVHVEETLYKNLTSGDAIFFPSVSVKDAADYAEPQKSAYVYVELWNAVFAPVFGEMTVPNKCIKIPLYGGKKFLKQKAALRKIEQFDKNMHDRLLQFCQEKGKDELAYILLPQIFDRIPDVFLDIMDYRSTITSVCVPFYRFIELLGIATSNVDGNALVSDSYVADRQIVPFAIDSDDETDTDDD